MEPAARQPFPPAEAGAILVTSMLVGIGLGVLIGWAAGSVTGGLIVGVVVGLPGGVFAVYRRYRGYF
jgi:F0F1-type ATP synthase assembly protein I